MSMNVNNMSAPGGGQNLGFASVGPHYARLVGFAYIGVHERPAWKGTPKPPCGKSILIFELLDDFVEIDGVQRPRWISKKENAFSSENSNLVKIYNTLDPTGAHGGAYDQLVMNTAPCIVNIAQKTDANGAALEGVKIDSISVVPNNPDGTAMVLNAAVNPVVLFDFDAPTVEAFGTLKEWMQKDVRAAQNFPGSECEKVVAQYDAQQAAAAQASEAAPQQASAPATQAPPQQAAPVQAAPQQASPPAQAAPQQAAPAQAAPAQQAAPTQQMPPAPPGFRYDPATNSFVPDGGAQAAPAGQQPAPAGSQPY